MPDGTVIESRMRPGGAADDILAPCFARILGVGGEPPKARGEGGAGEVYEASGIRVVTRGTKQLPRLLPRFEQGVASVWLLCKVSQRTFLHLRLAASARG